LVATKNAPSWRRSQVAIRSSASPYAAATSMWFTPCSSSSSSARSASRLAPRASAAAPKIARLDWWPVAPNGARSIMAGA
jgi:hypothetical protein